MHLFYQPVIHPPHAFLPEEESKHCVKVLRLQAKDVVCLVDGRGGFYKAEIVRPDPKKCELRIVETQQQYGARPYTIHIAIAPTKNADRIEWFVEKCVEIGIDEISFVICEHSERRYFKTDRVEKIAIGAMKQSIKAFLPQINEPIGLATFLDAVHADQKFIAHLEEGRREGLGTAARKNTTYCVLIGPEGDFSPKEIAMALEKGFLPVTLGESRLRTETAGIAACHLLNIIHQL